MRVEPAGVEPVVSDRPPEAAATAPPPKVTGTPATAPAEDLGGRSLRAQELRAAKRRLLAIAVVLVFLLAGWAVSRVPRSLGPPAGSGEALLNEVRFLPQANESAFVELKNGGTSSVSLAGLSLVNGTGAVYALPSSLGSLAAGAFLLILFDGQNRVEGATAHADRTDFLARDAGNVTLRGPAGIFDEVAWGRGQLGGVRLGRGGLVLPLEAGASIGRFPDSATATAPFDWDVFPPERVTPGAANPVQPVDFVDPVDTAILNETSVPLWWYPEPGAVRYRLQIARDDTFSAPLVDRVVERVPTATETLAPGAYAWRVEAIEADGAASPFSLTSHFTVLSGRGAGDGAIPRPWNETDLGVPAILQHKDTQLLLLESPQTGDYRWDAPHPGPFGGNPADDMNCAFASISMVSHYFGGDFSQDRLSYAVYKDTWMYGAEKDFQFGEGLADADQPALMTLALGGPGVHVTTIARGGFWENITKELDAGRPILLDVGRHVADHEVVLAGYREVAGNRSIELNDPGSAAPYWLPFDTGVGGYNRSARWGYKAYWLLSAPVSAGRQEASITTDSDGDGIMDFDEVNRFHTNVNKTDSDADGIPDKVEVSARVFDPVHGYQRETDWTKPDLRFDFNVQDSDGDGKEMEVDPDSDNGGCTDGREDANHDGVRDPGETSNFDPMDDTCLAGWITAKIHGDSSPYGYARGGGDIAVRVNVTTATYRPGVSYGDPAPNATYDWRADYAFTGNGSIDLESNAVYYDANGSWVYRDDYRADCVGNLTGDLTFQYHVANRTIEVAFTVALNESCPVREVLEFSDGRFTNTTRLLSGPRGANEFLDSTFAWERMVSACGDAYYGAMCPVELTNGTATLHDAGAVSTGTFKNYLADGFGLWDQQSWDLAMVFRLGHP